jgi:hypothetical protein
MGIADQKQFTVAVAKASAGGRISFGVVPDVNGQEF